MNNEKKVIGIVGGMGPQAGATLFNSVVCQTPAAADQQHLPVILMSFPQIVDRTAFLEGKESINPAFTIVQVINKLEQAGAAVIGIACNTSHVPEIYDVIIGELYRLKSRATLVHMPLATCQYIKEHHAHVRRVGLMTTNGTYKSGLYRNILQEQGYEVIIPDFSFQNEVVHKMVYDPLYGIKSNPAALTSEVRMLADHALHYFENAHADAIILGCTELSLAIPERVIKGMLIIDSIAALAKTLLKEATGDEKQRVVSLQEGMYYSGK